MIESLLTHWSDLHIAAVVFAAFVAVGLLLSAASHQLVGRRLTEDHKELADGIQKSIFAFSIFVLALTLADVRSNFARSGDNVIAEAFLIQQLVSDFDLDPPGQRVREKAALAAYAQSVVDDEWPSLRQAVPALSPVTDARLEDLRQLVRAEARANGRSLQVERNWAAIDRLDNQRQIRLQEATASAPYAFWTFTLLLMVAGAIMSGTEAIEWRRALVIAVYFGALGLIVALILILDRPFRGDTSVSPEPIRAVIARLR